MAPDQAERDTPAPLIVIVGATGTGKSDLALDVAEKLLGRGQPAEIVNADAMQLYRGMDIGTAKLSVRERRAIPHHLLDVLDVSEEASASRYQAEARAAIIEIRSRGAVPILVGGSGLYVSAVVFEFNFPGTDPVLRGLLEEELLRSGPGILYARLHVVDPQAAQRIGPSNGRRLVRALEIVELTGKPHLAALPTEPVYWQPSVLLGLHTARELLTPRLDARVERMWADGIVAEAHALQRAGIERGVTASRAIGYAQALSQVHGRLSEAEAIESTQQLTRRYARRQVSWFKRYVHTHWLATDTVAPIDEALARVDRGAPVHRPPVSKR